MPDLHDVLDTLRGIFEATGPGKPAVGGSGVPAPPLKVTQVTKVAGEALEMCANHWRRAVRQGDALLEAVDGVLKAAKAAVEASKAKSDTARRVIAAVAPAIQEVSVVGGRFYHDFADGRAKLYEAAQAMGVTTKRPGPAKKSPADIRGMDDAALLAAIEGIAKGLNVGIKQMLDKGAAIQKKFRSLGAFADYVGGVGMEGDSMQKAINEALDFRDFVSINVFGRVNGMMRRAVEVSNSAWLAMRLEQTAADWTAPWATDPEIGDFETL